MFNTDNIFHPNSLLFNGLPIMWPLKGYWAVRKVSDPPKLKSLSLFNSGLSLLL